MKKISVDTLIITVGTRQVGWRCQDGVIRSFGADGNISYPQHVNELYQELGISRDRYQEKDKTYPWSARDLGKRYYEHCVEWLGGNFSQVELLLDQTIIETAVKHGLKHIVLWGTDQPDDVSWFYRRLDTLWLAELMAEKIRSIYPDLRVDVHTPVINANDTNAIRQELEVLVLQEVLNFFSPQKDREFVLWIQNKGCAPAIASVVEICAAALVRQCQVFNASPNEPEEFFPTLANGSRTASPSRSFKLIPMGEYFWSLERLRVFSAWERGDFTSAQLWLKVHQNRHKVLYKLAGILALYANWETEQFVKDISHWLRYDVANAASPEQIQAWQSQLEQIKTNPLTRIWESCFLIELPLHRKNYTAAFMQFAQTIERLLYIQSQEQRWVDRGFITIPSHLTHLGNRYQPGFQGLIEGWKNSRRYALDNKYYQLLERIRDRRNFIVHEAQPVTLAKIRSVWADNGLFPVQHSQDSQVVNDLMLDVLKKVSTPPDLGNLLLQSLYKWGLNLLNSD